MIVTFLRTYEFQNIYYALIIFDLIITLIIFFHSLIKIWKIQRPLKAVKLNTVYTTMHMVCVFLLLLQWAIDLFFYDLIDSVDKGSKDPCA